MTTSPRKTAILAVLLCTFFTSHKVVACDEWKLLEGADTATLSAFARLESAPSGALALNRNGYVSIGQQRHTFDLLPLGILKQQSLLVECVVRIIEYAYAHQKPDGTFEYSEGRTPLAQRKPWRSFSTTLGTHCNCSIDLSGFSIAPRPKRSNIS